MKNMYLNIESMTESDIQQVAIMHNELVYYIQRKVKDPYWDFQCLEISKTMPYIQDFLNQMDKEIFVARDNERIVGFIACEITQCHLPISSVNKVGYISGAFVYDKYRGKGIMRLLEEKAVTYFEKNKIRYVELNFLSENSVAKECWEKLGYRIFRCQARKELTK